MKKKILKNILIFFAEILISYVVLGLTRISVGFNFFSKYPLFDITILMLLFSPVLIFRKSLYQKIYSYILFLIPSVLFLINSTYYSVCGSIFHLGLFNYFGEGTTMINMSYIEFDKIVYFILMYAFFVFIIELMDGKMKIKEKIDSTINLLGILSVLIIFLLTLVLHNAEYKKYYNDNKEFALSNGIADGKSLSTFSTKYLNTVSFDEFGILGFYKNDIDLHILKQEIKTIDITKPPTTNSTINSSNEDYYINKKFDATGLLEGFSVFTIMIETGMYQFLDEVLTPTLYEMASKGLNFTNNYSKNKTATSELIGIMGSFPTGGINYNYNQGDKNSVYKLQINNPYTIPKLLGSDYYKSFFHDGAGLYARDSIMGQLGFDSWKHEFYSVHPQGSKRWDFNGSYELDSVYLDYVLDDMYSISRPFYTFYTTLSTHGPYEAYTTDVAKEAFEAKLKLFDELGYTQKFEERESYFRSLYPEMKDKYFSYFKYVMCAMQNFDDALAKIVSQLKDEGLFDKTLFVIYGDHEAYYHVSATNTGLARAISGTNDKEDVEQYKTLMVFYNEKLSNEYRKFLGLESDEKIEITTFTSPYIIVPTTLDLLGIDYNTDYYYGDSFFKFDTIYDGIFYTHEYSSFFMDNIYSVSPSTHKFADDTLSQETIDFISKLETDKLLKLASLDEFYKSVFSYKE